MVFYKGKNWDQVEKLCEHSHKLILIFQPYFLLDQKVAKNQGCIKFSGKSSALQKRVF
jgi:hypothetical protein